MLAEESDFIQEELYRCSNFVHPRNDRVLYYDCTNYYFETEDETLIITYSPKYKAYQQKLRSRQIERAEKMIQDPGRKRRGKNQNDPPGLSKGHPLPTMERSLKKRSMSWICSALRKKPGMTAFTPL